MHDQRFVSPTILSFAVLGLVGGILACSVFGVTACSVVLTTPILCALIGVVAAPRRFWWLVTAALVPIAGVLNGGLTVLFVFGVRHYVFDGAYVGFLMSLPFLPALLFAGWMARSLRRARPRSLVAGIDARRFWWTISFVATSAVALVNTEPFGLFSGSEARVAALVSGAALVVMVFVCVRSLTALLRIAEAKRLAAFLRPAQTDNAVQLCEEYLDLGLGDARYVYVDYATLLRGAPTATLLLEGDPAQCFPIARNAVVLSALGAVFALAVLIASSAHGMSMLYRY
jgi:hypothetical protein